MLDPGQALQVYDVRVELGGTVSDEEVRAGLGVGPDADVAGWWRELEPRLGTTEHGRPAIDLEIAGPDVWTSALTAMVVLRQLDYDLHALHVRSREASSTTG